MKKVYFTCPIAFALYIKGEPQEIPSYRNKRKNVIEYYLNGSLVGKQVTTENDVFGGWIDTLSIPIPKENLKKRNALSYDYVKHSDKG
jgi:hypothetical protein